MYVTFTFDWQYFSLNLSLFIRWLILLSTGAKLIKNSTPWNYITQCQPDHYCSKSLVLSKSNKCQYIHIIRNYLSVLSTSATISCNIKQCECKSLQMLLHFALRGPFKTLFPQKLPHLRYSNKKRRQKNKRNQFIANFCFNVTLVILSILIQSTCCHFV